MFQFVEFAESGEALDADAGDTAFFDRIVTSDAGGQIASLEDLVKFAKERYPDHYAADAWKSPLDKPYGLNAMRRLWASYLHWGEVLRYRDRVEMVKEDQQ